MVKTYYKTSSYLEVKEAFRRRFPLKDSPTTRTICKKGQKTRKRMSKSVREDPAGGEQPGPKKQSKLLDCM